MNNDFLDGNRPSVLQMNTIAPESFHERKMAIPCHPMSVQTMKIDRLHNHHSVFACLLRTKRNPHPIATVRTLYTTHATRAVTASRKATTSNSCSWYHASGFMDARRCVLPLVHATCSNQSAAARGSLFNI